MTRAVLAWAPRRIGLFLSLFVFLVALAAPEFAESKPRSGRPVASDMGKVKAKVGARTAARKKARPVASQPLRVGANVAFVVDQETGEVLLRKNARAVLPIASLTKLMTGLVIAEAGLPLDERIAITTADVDRLRGSSSRLRVGTILTRGQALRLALMSSENRAAHALARTYPGGEAAFVNAMNVKAKQLGMQHTRYVEPTGLSSRNRSSARDLALLADAAYDEPLLRRFSTSAGYRLATTRGTLQYVNTNRLVRSGNWNIGLQKTGYISEAGQCLLMQARLAGRNLIMVFLDSASRLVPLRDAERVREWIAVNHGQPAG